MSQGHTRWWISNDRAWKKKKKPWRKTHLFLAAPQPVREYPVFLGSALTFTLTLVRHLALSNTSYVFIDRLYSNPSAGVSTNIIRFQHLTWSILASFQHLKPSPYKLNPQRSRSVSTLKMKMRCSWLSLWVFWSTIISVAKIQACRPLSESFEGGLSAGSTPWAVVWQGRLTHLEAMCWAYNLAGESGILLHEETPALLLSSFTIHQSISVPALYLPTLMLVCDLHSWKPWKFIILHGKRVSWYASSV